MKKYIKINFVIITAFLSVSSFAYIGASNSSKTNSLTNIETNEPCNGYTLISSDYY